MADDKVYYYCACPDCQWDCVITGPVLVGWLACKLCWDDSKHVVLLEILRRATAEDRPEGFDQRYRYDDGFLHKPV